MASELPDIPHNMRKVYRRFERWRGARTGRLPIPKPLWAAAVELARQQGVFHTAKGLRLEYGKLKQLVEAASPVAKGRMAKAASPKARATAPRRARSTAPRAFVELITPRSGGSPECRLEMEGPRGRMRIELKGMATAELVALSRGLWDGEAR